MDIANLLIGKPRKAEYGIGAVAMSQNPPLSLFQRSAQSMMREAQTVATTDATIRAAERVISNRIASTDWKLEDAEDVTVGDGPDDNSDPAYLAVKSLLETPYRPMPGDPVSTTPKTWTGLAAVTSRHMGVCGSAFWYLDQTDALAGTPLCIISINPGRMTPLIDDNGALTDWVLDADTRGGGVRLGLGNVLQFQLEPADVGVFPAGLVETALSKVEISKLSDRHIAMMLAAGGRLSGIMSPKEGYLEEGVYRSLVRDVRTISEAPDAAKRMLILRGPVDYKEAAASPADLDLVALNTLTRDDKLSLWGVPHSTIGIPTPGGLGGGTSKDSDEAILWRNAINPRLRQMTETIQFGLLDRFAALGIVVDIEFETPEFEDAMPSFDMAMKAANLPLTNRERRDLIGLDPFGDQRDDEVWLPAGLAPAYNVQSAPLPMEVQAETYTQAYEDPFENEESLYAKAVDVPAYVQAAAKRGLAYYEAGKAGDGLVSATVTAARDLAAGRVSEAKLRRIGPWIARHIVDLQAPQNSDPNHPDYPGAGAVAMLLWGAGTTPEQARRTQRWAEEAVASIGKAGVIGIRRELISDMSKRLAEVIAGIAAETATKVERNYSHIVAKPDDLTAYWNDAKVERLILDAMRPFVREATADVLKVPAKADLLSVIVGRLLDRVGLRIKTVPRTMLGVVRRSIDDGIAQGLSARDLGKLIETRLGEDEYIAERIARTESMRVVNQARIEGLRASGVTMVEMIDGDEDEACRDRNGQVVDLATAMTEVENEHPNGTLTLRPVTAFSAAADAVRQQETLSAGGTNMKATVGTMTLPEIRLEPQIVINIPETQAPTIHVAAPEVHVAAPMVNVAAPEAPVVNIAPAEVTVNVPEQKAGLVQDIRIVEMPARAINQVVIRDAQGRIAGLDTAAE